MENTNEGPFSYYAFQRAVAKKGMDINSEFAKIKENQEYKESIKEKLIDIYSTILEIQILIFREINLREQNDIHMWSEDLMGSSILKNVSTDLSIIQSEFSGIMSNPNRDFRTIFDEEKVLSSISQISDFYELTNTSIQEENADLSNMYNIQKTTTENTSISSIQFIKKIKHLQNMILELISGVSDN